MRHFRLGMNAGADGDAIHFDETNIVCVRTIAPMDAPRFGLRKRLDPGNEGAQPEILVEVKTFRIGVEIGEILIAVPYDGLRFFSVGITAKAGGEVAARQPQGAIMTPVDATGAH